MNFTRNFKTDCLLLLFLPQLKGCRAVYEIFTDLTRVLANGSVYTVLNIVLLLRLKK